NTTNLRYETWCSFYFPNCKCLLALIPARHDKHIGPLVITSLIATSRLTPRRHWMTSARGLTFTTTVRVIDRVHRNAAVGWANALPPVASSLTNRDILVIGIANLANGRHALHEHLARLARGQLQKRVVA